MKMLQIKALQEEHQNFYFEDIKVPKESKGSKKLRGVYVVHAFEPVLSPPKNCQGSVSAI